MLRGTHWCLLLFALSEADLIARCGKTSVVIPHAAFYRRLKWLLQCFVQKGDVVGPFFGFMGAAAALVFACELHSSCEEKSQVHENMCSTSSWPAGGFVAVHKLVILLCQKSNESPQ